MTELLNAEEIASKLEGTQRQREGATIVRDWTFGDFTEPWRSSTEAANHNPDILVHGWNKVRLVLTNHSPAV
jgi:4a-hydroxytetrahydrobiopterin dehydratase